MRSMTLLIAMLALASAATAYDLGSRQPAKQIDGAVYTLPAQSPRQGGDTIDDAIPITIPGTYTGTTVGYANNYDEICPYDHSTAPDVVYSVTPAADVTVDIDLCYSSYDTKLYIYDQDLGLVACNDDAHFHGPCFTYSSRLEQVALSAGATYYIVIDGYGAEAGAYRMDIAELEPCMLVCPSGAQLENEPPLVDGYADEHNGGCSSPDHENAFQWILVNDFCGVSGWYADAHGIPMRDTDWFKVPMAHSGWLEITGDAEYPTYVFELYPQDCGSVVVQQVMTIGSCNPETLQIPGEPGSMVWLWIAPTTYSGPVNEYNYVLRLNIHQPVTTESRSWTNVKSRFH